MSAGWAERRPLAEGALPSCSQHVRQQCGSWMVAGNWEGFKRVGSVHVNHRPKNYLCALGQRAMVMGWSWRVGWKLLLAESHVECCKHLSCRYLISPKGNRRLCNPYLLRDRVHHAHLSGGRGDQEVTSWSLKVARAHLWTVLSF